MTTFQLAAGVEHAGRWGRMTAPLLTGAGALVAVTLLHLRDPHTAGSYGGCPLLFVTGLYCPGCGGLRAVHDLTHADLTAALSSNLLVVAVLLPMAGVLWLAWTRSRWRGRPLAALTALPTTAARARVLGWSTLGLLLAFGLVRNLPVGSWFAP